MDEQENKERRNNVLVEYAWRKIPLKYKLIIIGGMAAIFLLVIFLVVLFTPLTAVGVVDIECISNPQRRGTGSNYSKIDSSNSYAWPIGSEETEVVDGVTYALGEPVPYQITSNFGLRDDPFGTGTTGNHQGLDISATGGKAMGTVNIIASRDGTVIYPTEGSTIACSSNGNDKNCGGGYGNHVIIQHNDGILTVYAHMYENTITVKAGDTVRAGQVIGKMGSSGSSTGMHLHFEVRENGQRKDPLNYISQENERPKKQTSTFVEGNDNIQTICLTLKDSGYSDIAVAGIMGNLQRESNYSPTVVNSIGASGIAQWLGGRANNLKNTYGENWNVLENQLEFLLYELNNTETSANNLLNDTTVTSAYDMGHGFCCRFERPGTTTEETERNCKLTTRGEAAEEILPYVQNGCS